VSFDINGRPPYIRDRQDRKEVAISMTVKHISFITGMLLYALMPPAAAAQDLDSGVDIAARKTPGKEQPGRKPQTGRGAPDLAGGGVGVSGPGMVFVEGLIAPDGATSVRLFRFVADSLGAGRPDDDALARKYEEYAAIGGRGGSPAIAAGTPGIRAAPPYAPAAFHEETPAGRDTVVWPDSAGTIVAVYAIQVGAFSVRENARKLSAHLGSKGFSSVVHDNLIDGKRLLHLVWVGRYDTREEALPEIGKIEELTGLRGVLREQMIWRRR
jgi:cell division septation protein DedD